MNISLYLYLNVTPKCEKQLISFEVLAKDVLRSHKRKNGCVRRTRAGCEAGSDLLVVLLLLLDKAKLSQDSCPPSTLLMPAQEGFVPLLLLNSPALGWLLVFKPFS